MNERSFVYVGLSASENTSSMAYWKVRGWWGSGNGVLFYWDCFANIFFFKVDGDWITSDKPMEIGINCALVLGRNRI